MPLDKSCHISSSGCHVQFVIRPYKPPPLGVLSERVIHCKLPQAVFSFGALLTSRRHPDLCPCPGGTPPFPCHSAMDRLQAPGHAQ